MNLLDMNGTGAVAACCGTMRPIRSFDSECYEGVSAGVAVQGVESLGGDIRRDDPVHGLGRFSEGKSLLRVRAPSG
jgi:hypothetical protein